LDSISYCRSSVRNRHNPRGPTGFGRRSCPHSGSFWGGLSDHWRFAASEQQDSILPWRNRTSYRSLCRSGNLDEPPHSACCIPRRNRGRSYHQLLLPHQEEAECIENLKAQIPPCRLGRLLNTRVILFFSRNQRRMQL